MELYLIATDGTEYPVRLVDAAGESIPTEYPYPGFGTIEHIATERIYRDGGDLHRLRFPSRVIDLVVSVYSKSRDGLLAAMARLYRAIRPDPVGLKPCQLKAVSRTKTAYLDIIFTGETIRQAIAGWRAELTLRFVAYAPHWYWDAEQSADLSSVSTISVPAFGGVILRYVPVSSTAAPAWDVLGTTNADLYALFVEQSGGATDIYIGGAFTLINGVGFNYVAKYRVGVGWSALGSGTNRTVWAIARGKDGLYVGGDFTIAGGVAANYIARWDGTAWSALGTGLNSRVYAIAYNPFDQKVYVGGNFTSAGGATASYIARWTGSAWETVGQGTDNPVYAFYIDKTGRVWVGGGFTAVYQPDGTMLPANRIAAWNPDTNQWESIGTALNMNAVFAIIDDEAGNVYVAGDHPEYTERIFIWNGSAWSEYELPGYGRIFSMTISGKRILVGREFVPWEGEEVNFPVMEWDGFSASAFGFRRDWGTQWGCRGIHHGFGNPVVILHNLATDSGTVVVARSFPVNNPGSAHVRPRIEIRNSQTYDQAIWRIENVTTGKVLRFRTGFWVLPGETIVVDCERLTITSNIRGNMLNILLPGSDFADFTLAPGINSITVLKLKADLSIKFYYRPQFTNLAEALA